MPQTAPRTPSYRLHKPSGQAVVTLNGRDRYLGRYDTPESRAEYDRLIAEWLTNGRRPAAGADLTIAELMLGYLKHADAYYVKDGRPTSEANLIRLSLRPLRQLYGHTPAKAFGPLALKTLRQAYIDSGLCRSEVNRRVAHVKRMIKWAVSNELVPPSSHHALSAVTGLRKGRSGVRESKPVRPVADAAVEAVRPFVGPRIWTLIQIQRFTGMRPGEATIMRTADIDTTGDVWTYTPGSHKTEHHGRERTIFIGPRAQAVLKPWLRPNEPTAYIFSPKESMAERSVMRRAARKSPVPPSQRARRPKSRPMVAPGECYSVRVYYHAIRRACEKAGVERWHPNQLRHTRATELRREFGLDTARTVLGHSSAAVTTVYAEADAEKARAAMGRVG